jgi:hypothetical protein
MRNRIAKNSNDQIIDLSNKTVIDNRNCFDGVIAKVKAGEGFDGIEEEEDADIFFYESKLHLHLHQK